MGYIIELTKQQKRALNRKFYLNINVPDKYEYNRKTGETYHEIKGQEHVFRWNQEVRFYIEEKYFE